MVSPELERIIVDFYTGSNPILAEPGPQDSGEHSQPEPLKIQGMM